MFNSTFLVTDLKAKCKEFNISYQGTKAILIKRLNEYITKTGINIEKENDDGGINVDNDDHVDVSDEEFSDVPINNQALDLESDGDTIETINTNNKRVKTQAYFTFTQELDNIEQAYLYLKDDKDNTWNKIRSRKTKEGHKECTTDHEKKIHILTLSICTGETGEDFKFVFESLKKAHKKVFNIDYRPCTLVADGADAITNGFMSAFNYDKHENFKRVMCWSHLVRNIDKRIYVVTSEEKRKLIVNDIFRLQKTYCSELFDFGYLMFEKKWLSTKDNEVKVFLYFFKKEWIDSSNSGWYEGLTQGEHTPSTDNALESFNGKIKKIHTLRERLAVNTYLTNTYDMIRKMQLKKKV
ncbi:unnamed protein product [Brachionus calyciflorus]|uniref:SAP domain-containing protein n=1 Tax=Brachionus calyciflorus TaxID=104777 RepID=A0A814IDJ2_9BILA|nr:unnamed protein product [Brachionus calyciflorus]